MPNGKKRKKLREDMSKAYRLTKKAALTFRSVCERSKDKGARKTACGIFRSLSIAAGTLQNSKDWITAVIR